MHTDPRARPLARGRRRRRTPAPENPDAGIRSDALISAEVIERAVPSPERF